MEPAINKSFVKDLHNIASELDVRWESGLDRFVIEYKSPKDGVFYRILEVKNEDGSFRPLDGRTLETLRRYDMSAKVNSPDYYFSKQYREMKEAKKRIKQKNREEHLAKARDLGKKKWQDAAENAANGIISPRQIGSQLIYSLPRTIII